MLSERDREKSSLALLRKTETQPGQAGSEAFFNVDLSRVRRSGSRQLPINSEAAPPLPPTVFFLAVSQTLSKSICATCSKSFTPWKEARRRILHGQKRLIA